MNLLSGASLALAQSTGGLTLDPARFAKMVESEAAGTFSSAVKSWEADEDSFDGRLEPVATVDSVAGLASETIDRFMLTCPASILLATGDRVQDSVDDQVYEVTHRDSNGSTGSLMGRYVVTLVPGGV